jgi:uncharacterized protein
VEEQIMDKLIAILAITILFALQSPTLSAQDDNDTNLELIASLEPGTRVVRMESPSNDQQYLIFINLPRGYDSSDRTYPVVYLTDPVVMYGMTTEYVRYLAFSQQLPHMIVVGIGYPDMLELGREADQKAVNSISELRSRDLSPSRQGSLFLEFLQNTLIPYVETEFRTDRDDRTIIGHSLGADFALYSLFQSPELFRRYIIASPAQTICIECKLDENTDINGIVFLSSGEFEYTTVRYVENAYNTLSQLQNDKLLLSMQIFERTGHMSVVPYAISMGLQHVFCGANYIPEKTCKVINVKSVDAIDDLDFPPHTEITTPDIIMPMKTYPARDAEVAGSCRNMDAIVLQAASGTDNEIWIQLQCSENSGWVQKSRLQG